MIPMLWGRLSPTFRANLASPTRGNPPPAPQRRPKKKWWGDGGKSHGALLILIEVGFVFAVIGLIMSLVAFNKITNPKDNSGKIVNMKITGLFFLCFGVLLLVPSGCVFMCRFTGVEGSRKRSQRGAEQHEQRAGRRARERGRERCRAASDGNTDVRETEGEEDERSRDRRRSNTERRSPRPTLRPLTRSRDRSRTQGQCRAGSDDTLNPGHNVSRSTSVSPSRSRGRSPPGPPPPADFSFPPPPPSYASAINLSDVINESERGSSSRASADATASHPLRRQSATNQPPTYSSVADLNEVTIEVGVPRRDSVVRYQATSDNNGQVDSPSAPPPSYEVALASGDERNDGAIDSQIV
ncbi:serine/arginine repetitive matrix protein 1-like [Branchiostoma floridae]|uniref:Serine/arginine repetitive matrix protein 1-like n=1 Tax=Branchiostoma floridae TaxID=7739 RepID=A0A9J7HQB5_BRAFL|nr:serine/arginine repetitive matrix protein 1-like [Branchiostoma floridae]